MTKMFAGHGETPRTLSCRLIYWVSYMIAVVMFAAYSGALISSLALQRIDPPFTTLSGLLLHGGYKVGTLAKSAHFNNFDVSVWLHTAPFIFDGPVPVAERYKAWDCGRSLAGVACSNPAGDIDVSLL
jgi:hypothetical protein